MARKTREEIKAEREAVEIARVEELKRTWQSRLFEALKHVNYMRVTDDGNFVVDICRPGPNGYTETYEITTEYNSEYEYALDDLENMIEIVKEYESEQMKIAKIRREALAKLSEEEKKALGLK